VDAPSISVAVFVLTCSKRWSVTPTLSCMRVNLNEKQERNKKEEWKRKWEKLKEKKKRKKEKKHSKLDWFWNIDERSFLLSSIEKEMECAWSTCHIHFHHHSCSCRVPSYIPTLRFRVCTNYSNANKQWNWERVKLRKNEEMREKLRIIASSF
jgi:hypothetical protein